MFQDCLCLLSQTPCESYEQDEGKLIKPLLVPQHLFRWIEDSGMSPMKCTCSFCVCTHLMCKDTSVYVDDCETSGLKVIQSLSSNTENHQINERINACGKLQKSYDTK